MLTGEFQHTLDAKGRVFLPARWREELADGVVISKGLDRCLTVMPPQRFQEQAQRLESLTFERRPNRAYSRLLFSGSYEDQLDRQGRITIPPALREYAGLGRDVVIVGVGSRAEIWDRQAWENFRESTQSEFEGIAEELDL